MDAYEGKKCVKLEVIEQTSRTVNHEAMKAFGKYALFSFVSPTAVSTGKTCFYYYNELLLIQFC